MIDYDPILSLLFATPNIWWLQEENILVTSEKAYLPIYSYKQYLCHSSAPKITSRPPKHNAKHISLSLMVSYDWSDINYKDAINIFAKY